MNVHGGAARQNFVAALLGGVVVAAIISALLVGGVIDAGSDRTIVRQVVGSGVGASAAAGDLPTINEIYRSSGPGVVNIRARVAKATQSPFGLPQTENGVATGSGFVLDREGYVLTNAHVVEGATEVTVQFEDEMSFEARIVGTDVSTDLALLRVKDAGKQRLRPLKLGDSDLLEVGTPVVAIGNPFGLERTVTAGIVSALQRKVEAPNKFQIDDVIQTDAAVNPGNSGGPLLDAHGNVVGINSQIATAGGGGNVGIAFAVPVNTAKSVIPKLRKDGKVAHAYLGVSTITLDEETARQLSIDAKSRGALVQLVAPGGPAAKAGLRAGSAQATIDGSTVVLGGDLLIEVDGRRITTNEDVAAAIVDNKPGDQIQIVYLRGGKRGSTRAKLGDRPNQAAAEGLAQPPGETPPAPGR